MSKGEQESDLEPLVHEATCLVIGPDDVFPGQAELDISVLSSAHTRTCDCIAAIKKEIWWMESIPDHNGLQQQLQESWQAVNCLLEECLQAFRHKKELRDHIVALEEEIKRMRQAVSAALA